jgi:ribosomal protein S18 acetylase RimI-like enzyme
MARIRPSEVVAPAALGAFVMATWGTDAVVAHGERLRPADPPGFVALDGDRVVGHASYRVQGTACELVAIAAEPRRNGVGTALLDEVLAAARAARCTSLWLTTTNDNLDALRFYQRRGFRLVELRPGAVDNARRDMKPELPRIGSNGIPMRDELDLAIDL